MDKEELILFGSDESAQYKTGLSGWVSRQGHYWGSDERAARYDGCTHTNCEDCGKPCKKEWLVCDKCKEKRDVIRYNAMPKEDWNGKGMLYSDATDKYFVDWDDIDRYLEEYGGTIESLRLIICEPQFLPLLDYDYGYDELPEGGELPDEVLKAIEDFNNVIKKVGAVSWIPSKKAVLITS